MSLRAGDDQFAECEGPQEDRIRGNGRDHRRTAPPNQPPLADIRKAVGQQLLVQALPAGSAARRARAILREILASAGVDAEDMADAETSVGELAANADSHAPGPYELRIVMAGGRPSWCEVVDGDRDPSQIEKILQRLRHKPDTHIHGDAESIDAERVAELLSESGHGLLIVHRLSGGRCRAFPTVACSTGLPGKAVAFALPTAGSAM